MTTFKYTGVSKEGTEISGVIRAYDEYEAVSLLRDTCSIVSKIEEVKESTAAGGTSARRIRLKDKDLSIICSQFHIILQSGMPIVKCVEMVAEQANSRDIRNALLKVAEDVEGGYTMAQSFENNMEGLPTTFVETIRAGEQSGTLELCFQRLQGFYDKASKTKGKVKGALTYPIIVICVAVVVVAIVMVKAVPMFTASFAELGIELPGVTKALIATSDFFVHRWWMLVAIGAAIALAYFIAKRDDATHLKMSAFALNKAPMHKIRSMNCAAQFATTFSTMIASGLPIIRGLEITADVVDSYAFTESVRKLKEQVEMGMGIADTMKKDDNFPKLLTEMTGVGEKSGAMESTLDVVADYYNNEVVLQTERLLAIMEPAITIGLALVTVVLLLAVYLPMFSMYGSMGI